MHQARTDAFTLGICVDASFREDVFPPTLEKLTTSKILARNSKSIDPRRCTNKTRPCLATPYDRSFVTQI